jgi:hypothetical protein
LSVVKKMVPSGEMAGASRTAPLISIFHLSWPSEAKAAKKFA